MPAYRVATPIKLDGKFYEKGSIVHLTAGLAKELEACLDGGPLTAEKAEERKGPLRKPGSADTPDPRN